MMDEEVLLMGRILGSLAPALVELSKGTLPIGDIRYSQFLLQKLIEMLESRRDEAINAQEE